MSAARDRESLVHTSRDFEIHIRQPLSSGAHPVTVAVPSEDRRVEGTLQLSYDNVQIARALAWMAEGSFDTNHVKEFGAGLFDALFRGAIKDAYHGSRQSSVVPLRFRLIIDAPALVRVPWELLYDPERAVFLALESSLVRDVSSVEPARPLKVKPPLRLLVIDAAPEGTYKPQNQLETTGIRQALADLIRSRRVEVQTLPHVTLRTLQNALREAADPAHPAPIHALHFIGHGAHDPDTNQTVLLFEDDAGQIDAVTSETLMDILRPFDLKLVFLNACQSITYSALDAALGFAPALLVGGVPAVIGMQAAVPDELAGRFARDFYESLADNRPVDGALADARRLARAARKRGVASLAIPVCYLRTATGQILEIEGAKQIPLTWGTVRPWVRQQATPRRLWGSVAGVIGLVSAVLGLYWGILPFLQRAPPMTGDINVAVAEFGELDAQGRARKSAGAHDLADSVYNVLDSELKSLSQGLSPDQAGFDIQVRPPAATGWIQGSTDVARASSAEKLAEGIRADVIVYGNLRPGSDSTDFVPEFYVSDRKLRQAEELVGQYEFGATIVGFGDIDNPVARQELRQRLLGRTRALAQFVIGLGYYALDQFDRAEDYFMAAEATQGWDERDGKEVLYHFLGNTALQLDDLSAAQGYYAHALHLEPEYARARLGTAEVVYLRSKADCTQEKIDVDGLYAAIRGYQSALTADFQPVLSDIPTKTAYALGRAYLCLSLAGVADGWADAERALLSVIADYEGGNARVRDLAAEAHAHLGLLYWLRPAPDEQGIEMNRREALAAYRKAIDLSKYAERQALFHSMLGQLHARLGECQPADQSLITAIRLDPEKQAEYEIQRDKLQEECRRAGN